MRRGPPAAPVLPAQPAKSTPARDAVYPLRVGPTRRYLVDHRNRPFLIVGDSPQAMVANISEKQAEHFLANRRAAGFNSVWVNLLCVEYTAAVLTA
jgi:hypothetical protein